MEETTKTTHSMGETQNAWHMYWQGVDFQCKNMKIGRRGAIRYGGNNQNYTFDG